MLQYNSHATDQDCVSTILSEAKTVIGRYPINEITRDFNSALDDYFQIAYQADTGHNLDDSNEASPPIDNQNIVSGTNRYKLSTFTEEVLSLIKLELLDSDGNTITLKPDTLGALKERGGSFDSEYVNADSGTPTKYIKYGDFIYFDKKPDWSKTAGLLVYFNRPAAYMAVDDTTKVPGVPGIHHPALCRMAALRWVERNNLPTANRLAARVAKDEYKIGEYFSRRTKDVRSAMSPNVEDNH